MLSNFAGLLADAVGRLPGDEKSARDALEEASAILEHAAKRRLDPSIPFEDLLRNL